MSISKLELFPWVAPQPQTTKLQGILNESIQIGVVPLGPQPQTTKLQGIFNEYIQIGVASRETFRVVEGTAKLLKLQNYRTF